MMLVSAAISALSTLLAEPGADFANTAEQLANIVAQRAAIAREYPAQTAPTLVPEDPLVDGLADLSRQAMTLSLRMEQSGGPEDMRCIYRGMAQDALQLSERLSEADLRADRLATYADIEYLLTHARQIGPLADQADIAPFTGVDPGCPRGPLR